jgi:hypothetical protein
MKKRYFLYFLLLFNTFLPLFGQSARVWVDSARVETGNLFRIYVETSSQNKPEPLELEPWEAVLPKDQILKQSVWEQHQNTYRITIECLFFEADSLALPSLNIGSESTNQLFLEVYATPVTDSTALAPIREIVPTPPPKRLPNTALILGSLGFLVLCGLAYLLYRLWATPPKKSGDKEMKTHQTNDWVDELNQIAQRIPVMPQKVFYRDISYLTRSWLEQTYQVAALEQTTEEILHKSMHLLALREQEQAIKQVLETSDLVKFAQVEPPIAQQKQMIELVRGLFVRRVG